MQRFDESPIRTTFATMCAGVMAAILVNSCSIAAPNPGNAAQGPDTSPTTVLSTNPAAGTTGVPTNRQLSATFGEDLNGATVTTANFQLTAAGGIPVSGTVNYVAGSKTAVFDPNAHLAF